MLIARRSWRPSLCVSVCGVRLSSVDLYLMSFPRTFELCCGLATGLLGIIVALSILKDDLDTSRRLEHEFHLFQELGVLFIFFMAPSLLVVIGSYFHAVIG